MKTAIRVKNETDLAIQIRDNKSEDNMTDYITKAIIGASARGLYEVEVKKVDLQKRVLEGSDFAAIYNKITVALTSYGYVLTEDESNISLIISWENPV